VAVVAFAFAAPFVAAGFMFDFAALAFETALPFATVAALAGFLAFVFAFAPVVLLIVRLPSRLRALEPIN
jgi:hypothetical protein